MPKINNNDENTLLGIVTRSLLGQQNRHAKRSIAMAMNQ